VTSVLRDELTRELAGHHAIERELGRGGMASVWLARDLRINRQVALKILHPELAGAIGVDRFAREVRTLATLTHPNIVPVIESGVLTTTDGSRLPWYTMPYIAGESLRARLDRESQLPIELALRITEQLASALGAAHALGIVHRDIKPENIVLADGAVYVVDFGIAKALIDTGDDRLTSTGIAIGTPAYMSPEQASAGVVDARTDQYSLACVLYEMLCGEPPFTGPTAAAIIARRFAEVPRSVRTVRSTTPVAVERAMFRALERVPADRFRSVTEFATALRSEIVQSPRRLFDRRALTIAMLAVAGVGVGGGWLLMRPNSSQRRRALDPGTMALYQRGVRGYTRRTPDGAREAIAAFSEVLARDSEYAGAWNGLAKTYLQAQRRQFALSGISNDEMIRRAVAASDRAIAIDSTSSDAWVTRALSTRAVDPTQERGVIQGIQRAIALDSGNAEAWHQLANSQLALGESDRALASWRESVRRTPAYTEGLAFLSLAHYWHRQFDSASRWADSAIAVDETYYLGRSTAGFVAVERGDYARAAAEFEAALRVTSGAEFVNMLAGRALTEARRGDRVRARATLQRADSLARQYTPVNSHTALFLAQGFAAAAQPDSAIGWLERYSPAEDLHFQTHLRCDPPFDPIRRDHRFQALIRRPPMLQGTGC
jgi:tRNA A-37 threonylcarbamoyl transferase component Bud32/tetratricopeptide (TPR) repeat protein